MPWIPKKIQSAKENILIKKRAYAESEESLLNCIIHTHDEPKKILLLSMNAEPGYKAVETKRRVNKGEERRIQLVNAGAKSARM